jgi:hypothetical protein
MEYIYFSFPKLSISNDNKKKPLFLPKWKEITESTCYDNHKGFAIRTGEISNLTVLDFDVKDGNCSYDNFIKKYSILKNAKTILTQNNGYHIYFNYTSKLKTGTNCSKSFSNVDIRNDLAFVFAPPTKVYKDDSVVSEYKDLGGEIFDIPDYIIKEFEKEQEHRSCSQSKIVSDFNFSESDIKTITSFIDSYWYQVNIREIALSSNYIRVSLNERYCKNYGKAHSSNNQYIIIDHYGARQKCHDTDCAYKINKKMLFKELPQNLKNLITNLLKVEKIANNETEAAIIILEELGDKLKSCNGRLFYLNDNIWYCNEIKIKRKLIQYITEADIWKKGIKDRLIPFSHNVSNAKNIRFLVETHVHEYLEDSQLYEKFHSSTKGKICFKDGVLDFANKQFIKWKDCQNVFSTVCINRNFESYFENPDFQCISEVKNILKDMYGDSLDTALHFMSRALAGHNEDKVWSTYLGNRNCGKGINYNLLKNAFGDYVQTFELGNLLYNRKTSGFENLDCSKKLYWLFAYEFVRLAISQEIDPEQSQNQSKISGKLLKKISGGGDTIVARKNFDREDTFFTTDTTFYIIGNDSVNVDSIDCNETRLEFSSVIQFKSLQEIENIKAQGFNTDFFRVADPDLKAKSKSVDFANAMVYLIYSSYQNQAVPIIRTYDEERATLMDSVLANFNITKSKNDIILCNDVHDILEDWNKAKIKTLLHALGIQKIKCNSRGDFRDKLVYVGISKKLSEENPQC